MQSVNRHGTDPRKYQPGHTDTRNAVGKGADANPYNAVSAVLASVTHGLDKSPDLPPACLSNAYESADAVAVPVTLDQARSAFRHSPIAQSAFGVDVVEHYARLAQIELDHHRTVVTDAEQERWFTRA